MEFFKVKSHTVKLVFNKETKSFFTATKGNADETAKTGEVYIKFVQAYEDATNVSYINQRARVVTITAKDASVLKDKFNFNWEATEDIEFDYQEVAINTLLSFKPFRTGQICVKNPQTSDEMLKDGYRYYQQSVICLKGQDNFVVGGQNLWINDYKSSPDYIEEEVEMVQSSAFQIAQQEG